MCLINGASLYKAICSNLTWPVPTFAHWHFASTISAYTACD